MPKFSFQARTQTGRTQVGEEEAESAGSLVGLLRTRGWMVVSIKPVLENRTRRTFLPARSIDVEMGLQQISVMLRSGLTLLTALRTAAEQAYRTKMSMIWNDLADRIQAGSNLADAMSQHKRFPRIVTQMVRVGEQTGQLEAVLNRAADSMQRKRLLKAQLLTALFYPSLVLVSALSVSAFIVFYLIPKLKIFLQTLGKKLPAMTQSLVDLSNFFTANGVTLLIVFVLLIFSGVMIYIWPPGRFFVDRNLLRLPIIGKLFRLSATAQFAQTLGVLLRSGVTLVEGLRTVEGLFRNRFLASVVRRSREAIVSGGSFGVNLAEPSAFMPMLPRMATVGESSGSLDDVLDDVARFHESLLQATIRRFSVLIEPVIIIVVGVIVGYVYIAFFVALFSVAGGGK